MTPVFRLCDEYVTRSAALDPVDAGARGIMADFRAATDYGPDGQAARADLMASTLAALGSMEATSEADRLAADYLRERLEAKLAWHGAGEPLRDLRAPFGLVMFVRDSVDLLPRDDDDAWRDIAARMRAIPGMFSSWRASLDAGLGQGLRAARRQAVAAAAQADQYSAGTHRALVESYGDGPLAAELAAAAAQAHEGYHEIARYLREDYAPRAAETDGVGAERYAIWSRLSLGADIDPVEAYDWGWAELARIEAEQAAEAGKVSPGASVDEARAILDQSEYVTGADAYLAWLQDRHDRAIEQLDVFHEGVPGHHLQDGAARVAGDQLSRFAKCTFVSGHGEGWALYAERLADELGWFSEPGTRLGMLASSAVRAARVVIDIGVHLDLPLPDGSRWSFEKACEVLRERGRAKPHRIVPEVTRYFGWPGQAISYKLGERGWLAAREQAMRRPGFDLKRWHTAALGLGPVGLSGLAAALSRIGDEAGG